jgi:GntR family transcriptional regulator/MocR family aminotransferase
VLGPSPASGCLRALLDRHVAADDDRTPRPHAGLALLLCPGLVHAIADLKIRADRGSPGLEQVVLARLIQTGRFDRHLRRMRKIYAGKRDALLLTALNEDAPTFT